ncbi:MAG TPA: hypothetical protein VIY54_13790 [Steroidobacteraceae bacterium]
MMEKVVADAPLLGQGDTEASPSPEPNATSNNEVAAATTVPAKIAAHDTADRDDSVAAPPAVTAARSCEKAFMVVCYLTAHTLAGAHYNGPRAERFRHDLELGRDYCGRTPT